MAATQIALLRGINVGRAKRIDMAGLRALLAGLGYGEVRTLLNGGNAVFTSPGDSPDQNAARIERAIAGQFGFSARVIVLTADELAAVIRDNPLLKIAIDPSRLLCAVLADPAGADKLAPLTRQDWSPEALALGPRVAYLWCPDGVLASRVLAAVSQQLGDALTTRNWATLTKLHALAQSAPKA